MQQPKLRRVEWLVEILDLDNSAQAYNLIAAKHLPEGAVVRLGRKIRINERRVLEWIDGPKTPG